MGFGGSGVVAGGFAVGGSGTGFAGGRAVGLGLPAPNQPLIRAQRPGPWGRGSTLGITGAVLVGATTGAGASGRGATLAGAAGIGPGLGVSLGDTTGRGETGFGGSGLGATGNGGAGFGSTGWGFAVGGDGGWAGAGFGGSTLGEIALPPNQPRMRAQSPFFGASTVVGGADSWGVRGAGFTGATLAWGGVGGFTGCGAATGAAGLDGALGGSDLAGTASLGGATGLGAGFGAGGGSGAQGFRKSQVARTFPVPSRNTAGSSSGGRYISQRTGPGSQRRLSCQVRPWRKRSVARSTSPSTTRMPPMAYQDQGVRGWGAGAGGGGGFGGGVWRQANPPSNPIPTIETTPRFTNDPREGKPPNSGSSPALSRRRAGAPQSEAPPTATAPALRQWDCALPASAAG